MFQITLADFTSPSTRSLLALHLESMRTSSPPGTSFALDLSELQTPEITAWTVRESGAVEVLGIGALKTLPAPGVLPDGGRVTPAGELKSMRTHPDHLHKGVARALLEHIISEAKARGMTRLSLETGTGPAFEAAARLYESRGFVEGEAFGDYLQVQAAVGGSGSGFNRFYHLELSSVDSAGSE